LTVAEGRLIEQLDPGGLDAGERWLAGRCCQGPAGARRRRRRGDV